MSNAKKLAEAEKGWKRAEAQLSNERKKLSQERSQLESTVLDLSSHKTDYEKELAIVDELF